MAADPLTDERGTEVMRDTNYGLELAVIHLAQRFMRGDELAQVLGGVGLARIVSTPMFGVFQKYFIRGISVQGRKG